MISATPDVSSYTYDESSGYYYDAQTTLYYDANSTYYYNSKTGSYCYWSQEHHTYLPANSDDNSGKNSEEPDKRKEDRKDKIKTAKKIAKDMEKWAKTLNQRKEAARASLPASGPAPATVTAPAPAVSRGGGLEDLAFSMLQKQTGSSAAKPVSMSFSATKPDLGQTSGLARLANYGSDSDNEDQVRFKLYHLIYYFAISTKCTSMIH